MQDKLLWHWKSTMANGFASCEWCDIYSLHHHKYTIAHKVVKLGSPCTWPYREATIELYMPLMDTLSTLKGRAQMV